MTSVERVAEYTQLPTEDQPPGAFSLPLSLHLVTLFPLLPFPTNFALLHMGSIIIFFSGADWQRSDASG